MTALSSSTGRPPTPELTPTPSIKLEETVSMPPLEISTDEEPIRGDTVGIIAEQLMPRSPMPSLQRPPEDEQQHSSIQMPNTSQTDTEQQRDEWTIDPDTYELKRCGRAQSYINEDAADQKEHELTIDPQAYELQFDISPTDTVEGAKAFTKFMALMETIPRITPKMLPEYVGQIVAVVGTCAFGRHDITGDKYLDNTGNFLMFGPNSECFYVQADNYGKNFFGYDGPVVEIVGEVLDGHTILQESYQEWGTMDVQTYNRFVLMTHQFPDLFTV